MSRIHPVVHVLLLCKYKDGGRVSFSPAVLLDGEEECEIHQVLSHRDRSRGKQKTCQLKYFVRLQLSYHVVLFDCTTKT